MTNIFESGNEVTYMIQDYLGKSSIESLSQIHEVISLMDPNLGSKLAEIFYDLEGYLESNRDEYAYLSDRANDLEYDVEYYQSEHSKSQDEVYDLEQEISELNNRISELESMEREQ